jgi:hypothetical protein
MDSPVLEAALVDNGSHFLARDQVIIIYNVEPFIRHNGFPEYWKKKDAKKKPLRPFDLYPKVWRF